MANAPRAQTTKAPASISFQGILRRAPWATVPSVLNVNMASLLRSALGWRDIVPGAQTERRGGAGPVRAWLGGEYAPAACSDTCRYFFFTSNTSSASVRK